VNFIDLTEAWAQEATGLLNSGLTDQDESIVTRAETLQRCSDELREAIHEVQQEITRMREIARASE
jgi:hypothetical protein